jgi:rhodanese-related sulfurtransferase
MKKQFLIVLFLVIGLNSFTQNYESFEELKNEIISKTIPLISVDELKKVENTKAPLLVLDAREEVEYNVSHIKNAKYVGYDNFKIKTLKEVDKNTTVIVYCSVGYRSEKIGEKLKKAGFTKVMNLQGGIFDWVNSGYSVYDNTGKQTLKVHAYDKSWGKWLTKGEKIYE